VAGIRPFTVRLVGAGAFPNLRRMNVVWVGMEGAEPLVEIARRLEAGMEPLGYPREGRDFSAHVTVARVKGPRGLDDVRRVLEARARDAFGGASVDRIRLKKSVLTPQGPEYSTVAEVSLGSR
jgi:2'-5' RNA ligase